MTRVTGTAFTMQMELTCFKATILSTCLTLAVASAGVCILLIWQGDTPTYTVGADGTVSYYHVTTVNQNKDKDPLLTVKLHDIINYVNSHHAVSEIKAKAQDIHATIDNN